jgi:serine/threonine-protein kinase
MPPQPDAAARSLGLSPGDVLGGRYEIIRVIGVGGTGAVFEARHQTIHRTVAVKVLLPELVTSPAIPQRFLQEAQTSNAVRHRNIVEVLDFGSEEGRLYMVMEYLRGENLAVFLHREAPMSPARAIKVLDPIMSALQAAHAAGIVHRDIKPQNIFLSHGDGDEEPVPKLIDFGIARRLAEKDARLTATGMILGTPAYMSPEQARGEKEITAAADQYAIGVILFHALTRRIPYNADTFPAMLIAIVTTPPTDIATVRPDLDPGLCRVVMRALTRDPSERYPSLGAFRDALKPYANLDVPTPSVSSRPPNPLASEPTRPDGTPVATAPAPRPVSIAPQPTPQPTPQPYVLSATPATPVLPDTLTPPVRPRASAALIAITVAIGLVSIAMMALVATLVLRRLPAREPPRTEPRVVATRAPSAPESVTIRVDVDPPTAAILIDGTLVGHGHAELLRPRGDRPLQLRLTAPGRADVTDVLPVTSDVRVSRVLVPLGAPNTPTSQHHTSAPTVPQTQTQTPVPTPPTVPHTPHHDPRHPRIDTTNPF